MLLNVRTTIMDKEIQNRFLEHSSGETVADWLEKKEIQNRFLEHSSPDTVYAWLEKNANASKLWLWFGEKPTIELMLLERKEPLIDLALALFSKNKETRNTLYDRGDSTLQKAILANKDCGYFPALENLLKKEKTEYLEILLSNTENRLFLVDLFKKENHFSKVKKTYWLSLLSIVLIRNKILAYPYSEDDLAWKDDMGETAPATRLYRSVYGLFDILDVNNKNAELLAYLVERLPALHGIDVIGLDVKKMLAKWQNPKPVQHFDFLYFHNQRNDRYTTLDKKIESRCRAEWDFVTCRTYLANHILKFKDSDDVACRLAYYRNENFNWSEEETNELLENWRQYEDTDSLLFLENIIKNNSIYWNKEIRDFIGDGIVLSRTSYKNEYLEKLKKFQDDNPECFVDNSHIQNIESELNSQREELHIINTKIEENKQLTLKQKTTSFIIVFLLVIIVLLSLL